MKPSGLKVTQFAMLSNIMLSGPLSTSELAQILILDRTTLVRNLKSLERQKFIKSITGDDARMRPIAITQKGRTKVTAAVPYWVKAQTAIGSLLGTAVLGNFTALLMDIEMLAD